MKQINLQKNVWRALVILLLTVMQVPCFAKDFSKKKNVWRVGIGMDVNKVKIADFNKTKCGFTFDIGYNYYFQDSHTFGIETGFAGDYTRLESDKESGNYNMQWCEIPLRLVVSTKTFSEGEDLRLEFFVGPQYNFWRRTSIETSAANGKKSTKMVKFSEQGLKDSDICFTAGTRLVYDNFCFSISYLFPHELGNEEEAKGSKIGTFRIGFGLRL